MKLIDKPKEWFESDEAQKKYDSYSSLSEKAIHLYSYLRLLTGADKSSSINPEGYEEENALFKIAFYLADEVSNSDLPYASYKKLIAPNENPYVAYLTKAKEFIGAEKLFITLSAILHGKVDAFDDTAWIYDMDFWRYKAFMELEKLGCGYKVFGEYTIDSLDAFEIEKKYEMLQLELYWLFRCDNVNYSKITEVILK